MNPRHHKSILPTILTLLLHLLNSLNASPSPPITALYAFGDSTVDSGNNNYIPTFFRINHPPYGKSFPSKLSTDGKLATDFLVSSLRLKPTLPAYLNPTVKPVDLLTGVSFASAGGGLDDRTAMLSLSLSMDKQWSYFEEAVNRMKSVVGVLETNRVIKNALFVIGAGTNDMIYNVYDHLHGNLINISDYQDYLLSRVEAFVQRLHKAGASRIIVTGLPPVGCLPVQVTLGGSTSLPLPRIFRHRTCKENQNADSLLYNQKLQKLTFRLSRSLGGSKVLYLDIYSPIMDMIKHPDKYGFEETLKGGCGAGVLEARPLCWPLNPNCMMFQSISCWS